MVAENRTELTYRYERWRAISAGIIETAGSTFLILIAVRWYQAGSIAKALVASGSSVGLICSPLLVSRVESSKKPIATAASRVAAAGALGFLAMAFVSLEPVFVLGAILAMACASVAVPLLTQIYQENYPEQERGRRFSRTVIIRIAAAALFSELAGRVLSHRINHFPALLVVFAGAFVFASYCLGKIPSRPLSASGGTHPFRALKYARDDTLFRQTLIAWMFLGFANLMMVPLRVEYLANPKYGITLHGAVPTVGAIAFLTGVLPNVARLLMNPLWGWLFDRMNFFLLRVMLNFGFMLGILTFFTSDSLPGLVLGAVFYGISIAGGDVAWSLWVTKFAPPERVADYMAVHTFFTGVRGVVAPLVAFQLASVLPLKAVGWISAGLIFIGSAILVPEIKLGRAGRRAAALVEEISD